MGLGVCCCCASGDDWWFKDWRLGELKLKVDFWVFDWNALNAAATDGIICK